jgi:hypothetical protein
MVRLMIAGTPLAIWTHPFALIKLYLTTRCLQSGRLKRWSHLHAIASRLRPERSNRSFKETLELVPGAAPMTKTAHSLLIHQKTMDETSCFFGPPGACHA